MVWTGLGCFCSDFWDWGYPRAPDVLLTPHPGHRQEAFKGYLPVIVGSHTHARYTGLEGETTILQNAHDTGLKFFW